MNDVITFIVAVSIVITPILLIINIVYIARSQQRERDRADKADAEVTRLNHVIQERFFPS